MAGTVGTKRSPAFSPLWVPLWVPLWLLLWVPRPHGALAAPPGARSLAFTFTVTPNGQAWCEIQGQVNGNTFLYYTCGSNNVTLFDVPGMSATQAWNQLRELFQDLMDELRKVLLDIKAEIAATGSSFSLQGSMMCKEESKGRTSASLKFGLDGQIDLLLDPMNGNWIILNGKGELLKKALASDRDMTHLLIKTSAGDCMKWLEQVLCLQDEILSIQAASPNAIATATGPSKANTSIILILLGIFIFVIIIGILG